ncbi:MAG: DUF3618 domain-containing protein [Caldilineaceae bacterium]
MTTNFQNPNQWEQTSTSYQRGTEGNADSIRSEIEATRNRMSSRLDQIQDQFQPENVKQQAQDFIQSAVTDGVATVKQAVNEYVQQINWPQVRNGLLDTARSNPIPTALIGFGVGWIIVNSTRNRSSSRSFAFPSRDTEPYQHGLGWREETPQMEAPGSAARRFAENQDRSYKAGSYDRSNEESGSLTSNLKKGVSDAANQVRESASQVKETVSDQAGQWVGQVQDTVNRVGENVSEWQEETFSDVTTQAQRTLEENPLLFGAVALAVGAGLGLLLPATRYENQVVGELRDQAVQKAEGLVEDVKERAKTVVDEVQPELEKTAANVVQKVKDAGKQAADEVKQSLHNAGEKLDQQPQSGEADAQKERALVM